MLRETAEDLRDQVNAEFWDQAVDRKRITEEERKAVSDQGFDIDELVEGYRNSVGVIETEEGFKVGLPDEVFFHAGRAFDMTELALIHELGTATVAQRAHFVPVWERFRQTYPEIAEKIRERVREKLG